MTRSFYYFVVTKNFGIIKRATKTENAYTPRS